MLNTRYVGLNRDFPQGNKLVGVDPTIPWDRVMSRLFQDGLFLIDKWGRPLDVGFESFVLLTSQCEIGFCYYTLYTDTPVWSGLLNSGYPTWVVICYSCYMSIMYSEYRKSLLELSLRCGHVCWANIRLKVQSAMASQPTPPWRAPLLNLRV